MLTLIPNKYKRIYDALCERGQNRQLFGYSEKHHILPKSLGGKLNKANLVRLTAREHYIAHLCLVRCTEGVAQRKMIFAVHCFRYLLGKHITKFNSRLFESNRKQMSENVRQQRLGFKHSEATKQKMSELAKGHTRNLGFKHSVETKKKWSEVRKGKPNPHASESLRRYAVLPKTEKWKAGMRITMKGNQNPVGCKRSEAHKEAIRQSNIRRWNDPAFVKKWNENVALRKSKESEV